VQLESETCKDLPGKPTGLLGPCQRRADDAKRRVLIMVSKFGHCLNDLLFRYSCDALRIDIPAVVSNHPDLEPMVKQHGIAFHHIPISADTKAEAEAETPLEAPAEEPADETVKAPADETTPTNEADFIGTYKRSKFLAERAVMESSLTHTVFAPSIVYAPRHIDRAS